MQSASETQLLNVWHFQFNINLGDVKKKKNCCLINFRFFITAKVENILWQNLNSYPVYLGACLTCTNLYKLGYKSQSANMFRCLLLLMFTLNNSNKYNNIVQIFLNIFMFLKTYFILLNFYTLFFFLFNLIFSLWFDC